MTSRELCTRAIEFRNPERLPMSYPSCGFMDLAAVMYTAPKDWKPTVPGELGSFRQLHSRGRLCHITTGDESCAGRTIDEWGCVWEKTEVKNMGQIKRHPVADWAQLDDYTLPDPDDDSRYDAIEAGAARFPDKYLLCLAETILTLWERYYSLRGFGQALTDLYMHPEKAHDLLERILGFHIAVMRNLGRRFRGRVHGFGVSDDWGTQTNTLIPVPVWRVFFKERYRRLCAAIHDAGMHAILHSDGRINDLIPDLIEVGFDALNLHSPRVVGIEEIGLRFAGKVAFLPCIDIQNTFARGSTADVRREAKMLLEYWGTRNGGIIPAEYDREAVGAPFENVEAAFQAFQEYGLAHCGLAHANRET